MGICARSIRLWLLTMSVISFVLIILLDGSVANAATAVGQWDFEGNFDDTLGNWDVVVIGLEEFKLELLGRLAQDFLAKDALENILCHGFGLRSSANAAVELGRSLSLESEGAGYGATFWLELPIIASKA